MTLYHTFITAPLVPWRIRQAMQEWVETTACRHYSKLYQWLHFGRITNPVKAVTQGPLNHFFGYYDKSPWDASGRYLVGHEVAFNDRAPTADDAIGIGLIDLGANKNFIPLAISHAWNWQQGTMLQWYPQNPERLLVYNDRRNKRFVAVVLDVEKGEQFVYDRPLYAILPDGSNGFSLNFARLAIHRPGYGYAGVADAHADSPHPAEDGLWRINLSNGQSELIVSLAELAARNPKPSMEGAWHYINHIQPSRAGRRIAFFHIWHRDTKYWDVRLYTCNPDGSDLNCLLDSGFISHYDWQGDEAILVWANHPVWNDPNFLRVTLDGAVSVFGKETLREDGHCTFSPTGNWVLNDTYPDRYDMRSLMIVQWPKGKRIDIARLYSPKSQWWGEVRCDLHPRWSRDGRQVCIDSVHEGTRQMYVIDVGHITE